MSKIIIILNNAGGELDRKELPGVDPQDGDTIAKAVVELVLECGLIHAGDTITVTEQE